MPRRSALTLLFIAANLHAALIRSPFEVSNLAQIGGIEQFDLPEHEVINTGRLFDFELPTFDTANGPRLAIQLTFDADRADPSTVVAPEVGTMTLVIGGSCMLWVFRPRKRSPRALP